MRRIYIYGALLDTTKDSEGDLHTGGQFIEVMNPTGEKAQATAQLRSAKKIFRGTDRFHVKDT